LNTSTDGEAAEECKIGKSTMYSWKNKAEIELAVGMMLENTLERAMDMAYAAVSEAMQIKLEGMRDTTEKRLRQEAASEILDRVAGKPTQRIAPVMPNGIDAYQPDSPDAMDRTLARIAEMQRLAEERKARAERQSTAVDTTAVITTLPIDTPMALEHDKAPK
jgi:hypothetical protein